MSDLEPRIRVVGGPWPERIGATGCIRVPTPAESKVYPFAGLGRDEVVVLLDDDPLTGVAARREWTCAISVSHVEFVT